MHTTTVDGCPAKPARREDHEYESSRALRVAPLSQSSINKRVKARVPLRTGTAARTSMHASTSKHAFGQVHAILEPAQTFDTCPSTTACFNTPFFSSTPEFALDPAAQHLHGDPPTSEVGTPKAARCSLAPACGHSLLNPPSLTNSAVSRESSTASCSSLCCPLPWAASRSTSASPSLAPRYTGCMCTPASRHCQATMGCAA